MDPGEIRVPEGLIRAVFWRIALGSLAVVIVISLITLGIIGLFSLFTR